jgi:hypothetical protein
MNSYAFENGFKIKEKEIKRETLPLARAAQFSPSYSARWPAQPRRASSVFPFLF